MTEVLVSYGLQAGHREIIEKVLSDKASLVFLPDVADKERRTVIERAEAVISWNPEKEFTPEELESLNCAGLLQLVTAGADHLPFRSLRRLRLMASNPGAFAEPMAEHILGMTLALAKRLCVNNARLKAGEFDQKTRNKRIKGLAFGVLGFGGIGQAASRLMREVGLKIFAINTSGETGEPVHFIGTLDHLEFVLKSSDVLLVSLPLTVRTKGLIDRRELEMMKPDAILINVARGAIIDEKALYEHLRQNPEFSAGIDTWWIEPAMGGEFKVNFPFFDLPNFLGSPHNSTITPGVMSEAVRLASENVARFLAGEKVRGVVRSEEYLERWV